MKKFNVIVVAFVVLVSLSGGYAIGQTAARTKKQEAWADFLERESRFDELKKTPDVLDGYAKVFEGYDKATKDSDYLEAVVARTLFSYELSRSGASQIELDDASHKAQMNLQAIQIMQNQRIIKLLEELNKKSQVSTGKPTRK